MVASDAFVVFISHTLNSEQRYALASSERVIGKMVFFGHYSDVSDPIEYKHEHAFELGKNGQLDCEMHIK